MDTMPQPKGRTFTEAEVSRIANTLWLRVAVVCGATFALGFGAGAWLF
jgi:hypothetical protein